VKLNCIRSSNISWQLNKEAAMGEECGTHGEKNNAYKLLQENLKEREHLKYLAVGEWMYVVLKWLFKKYNKMAWSGLIWLRIAKNCGIM
jgi:hypothetical protein